MSTRVFISSTIYDFEDLRGSIKYYLEELGYKVLASEHADFEKDLDKNSYEACLDSIKRSDIFILLVGGRKGGIYREVDNSTITQMEYRCAYEEFQKKGRPLIVPFVRQSIWDRIDCYRQLKKADPSNVNFKDKSIDDPEFTDNFLREITRSDEMKSAAKTDLKPPAGNWVHRFSAFREISAALEQHLKISMRLEETHLLGLVKDELYDFSCKLTTKIKPGLVLPLDSLVEKVAGKYKFSKDDIMYRGDTQFELQGEDKQWIMQFLLFQQQIGERRFIALEKACFSPHFGEYNFDAKTYQPDSLSKALNRTLIAINKITNASYIDNFNNLRKKVFKGNLESLKSTGTFTLRYHEWGIIAASANAIKRAFSEMTNILSTLEFDVPINDDPMADYPQNWIDKILSDTKKEEVQREDIFQLLKACNEAYRQQMRQ